MFEKKYDVAVCGGGIAGVAAALAAARRDQKTALIEKTIFTGGLATTGLIYIYLPLCDGNGTQVTFGIVEELLLASLKYGPGDVPDWRKGRNAEEAKRYRVCFSPASFILTLDELLVAAGVDIWFDTLICAANVHDHRLTSVEIENKSGRGRIAAGCFVDATGDADIAHQAGLTCPTAQNALALWALEHAPDKSFAVHTGGGNVDQKRGPFGITGDEVTRFVLDGRAKYRARLADKDRRTVFPLALPAMAQFRTTRQIPAQYRLRNGEDWTHFDDAIGLVADWRKPGLVWEIPYRSMLPFGVKNLVAAGRCTAAEDDAWEVTRVIPAAALTGEAAGTTAALAVAAKISPDDLPVGTLQDALRQAGNRIHFEDVGLTPSS
jgi:hypothetical protein